MRINFRRIVDKEVREWMEENPREVGERRREYISRARRAVEANIKENYSFSPTILMILFQLLPIVIEWWLNRRS